MLTICAQGIVVKFLMLMLEFGVTSGWYIYLYAERKYFLTPVYLDRESVLWCCWSVGLKEWVAIIMI